MNYKKINFEIVTRTNGVTIRDQENDYAKKYLRFDCINPINLDERSHRVTCFDEATIKHYEAILPESRGGKLPDTDDWTEDKMPIQDRMFLNGESVEFDFGGQYCQKYSRDIINGEKTIHAAGDWVCIKGTDIPKVTTRITVFCQYYYETENVLDEFGMPVIDEATFRTKVKVKRDENGLPIKHWTKGWEPEVIGANLRDNFYVPLSEYQKEMGAAKAAEADVSGAIPPADLDEDDA